IRPDATEPIGAAAPRGDGAGLVALPGERLSRAAGPLTEADLARAEVFTLDELDDAATDAAAAAEAGSEPAEDGEEPRRRRRRGGRGRGRGRGRGEDAALEGGEAPDEEAGPAAADAPRATALARADDDAGEDEEIAMAPAPRGPRTTPFGSVWDSQLGTPAPSLAVPRAPLVDEEDFEEPEIPEYLIAEQRRSGNRGGAGPSRSGARGGRSAYQSAMDRERYGRGSGGGGGINRYPDVSGRGRSAVPPRDDRNYRPGDRPSQAPAPMPRSSSEPWSDVPPELEALLRAQVAQKPAPARSGTGTSRAPQAAGSDVGASAPTEASDAADTAAAKPRATRKPSDKTTGRKPAAKPRATRKTAAADAASSEPGLVAGAAEAAAGELAAKPPAKPRATRKPATAKATAASAKADSAEGDAGAVTTPKRRTTRKTAPVEPI
ncbi:MAG: hypothetical protein ABJC39_11910, partial [Chloroflexota bacterium]